MFAVRLCRTLWRRRTRMDMDVRAGRAWRRIAVLCLWLPLLLAAEPACAAPVGTPPITRFTPDLEAYPQTFDIAQDEAAVVYVAGNDGVLIFDGARWKLLRLPNGDIARSLAYDGHGRVYVGGYGLFGYIERDAAGVEQFHDLTPLYKELLHGESFEDVWDTLVSSQGVFFMALGHLFQYQPQSGALRLWRYPQRYGTVVEQQGQILVQFREFGLKRLKDDGWEPVPGSEPLRDLVYRFLHLPDGGLLTLARDGRWREFRDGQLSDYAMPPGFPPSSFMMNGRELPDGSIALAGQDGQLHLLDPVHHTVRSFQVDNSALNGVVPAADGGLLTLSNLSLFHVAWPTSWSVVGAETGLSGGIHHLAQWNGRWLALADSGVYEARERNGSTAFQRLDWTDFEAWDLLPLDSSSALLAESYNLKLVQNGHARNLFDSRVSPLLLQRSTFDPDLIYVGTETGLAVLRRERGQWKLAFNAADLDTSRVTSLVELGPRDVLAGSDRGGVHRLKLAADASRIIDSHGYGDAEGIGYGRLAAATIARLSAGEIVAATGAGLYRWTGDGFQKTPLEGLEALRAHDEELSLSLAPNGELWAWSYQHVYHRPTGGAWGREPVDSFMHGAIEAQAYDGRDTVLFACNSQLLRHDGAVAAGGDSPRLSLRSVEHLDQQDRSEALSLHPAAAPRYEQQQLALRLRVALPDYRGVGEVRYQSWLEGFDQHYSEWSDARSHTYRLLPPGDYVFHARARDSLGQVSEIAPYRFVVVQPWFATTGGRIAGLAALGFLGMALGMLVSRLRSRRLALEKFKLESLVLVRTRELESANRRLDKMAHLDGLTEIPNRRRLNDYLSEVWARCAEQGKPVSVLVMDVDYFKQYNDRYGHLAGDEVLKKLTQVLSICLRRSDDLVARFGGDEFVAVLPGASLAVAGEVAEVMRARVAAGGLGITISIGCSARVPQPNESVWALVHEVDGALYQAKRGGRNRVAVFGGNPA
ncbi:MAG TPA: diguanylate cyclase [Nevskia sp.]|nr:diguanylate cyclase [Nevskia sp.]